MSQQKTASPGVTHFGAYHRPPAGNFSLWGRPWYMHCADCRSCHIILALKLTRLSAQVVLCCFILTRICSKSKSMAQSRSYLRPCVGLVLNKRSSPPPPLSPCIWWELRWNRKSKLGKRSTQVKQEIQVWDLSRHCLLLAWVSPFLQGFAEHLKHKCIRGTSLSKKRKLTKLARWRGNWTNDSKFDRRLWEIASFRIAPHIWWYKQCYW